MPLTRLVSIFDIPQLHALRELRGRLLISVRDRQVTSHT